MSILALSFNEKIWDFLLSGGFFMVPIGICSFVGIAVCIHRALSLRWNTVIPLHLRRDLSRVGEIFCEGHAAEFRQTLKRSDSPMGRIGWVAVSGEFTDPAEARSAVEATAREQLVKLENGMGTLEVTIAIAPLLGLLGTVSGLVGVFGALGQGGTRADPSLIAAGIAEALNTTIAGLAVAVIIVVFHSYFNRRIERIAARLEVIAAHLLHEFFRNGGARLYAPDPAHSSPQAPGSAPMLTDDDFSQPSISIRSLGSDYPQ